MCDVTILDVIASRLGEVGMESHFCGASKNLLGLDTLVVHGERVSLCELVLFETRLSVEGRTFPSKGFEFDTRDPVFDLGELVEWLRLLPVFPTRKSGMLERWGEQFRNALDG